MPPELINYVVVSLLSALLSSFLASYLTYRYTEKSWRRRMHLKDIKDNCLPILLKKLDSFEKLFKLHENKITAILNDVLDGEPPTTWCYVFTFGFNKPPTTHFGVLLHDLENHFPDLVKKLKEFEGKIKELCPRYYYLFYDLIKAVFNKTKEVTEADIDRKLLTEAVIMTLAGYSELDFPNDANYLKKAGLYQYIGRLADQIKREHASLVNEYVAVRSAGERLVDETKSMIIKAIHTQKLPGKCNLY